MANPPWSQSDSYRPRYDDRGPPRPPPEVHAAMYHFRGNARDRDTRRHEHRRNGDAGHQFSFRASRKISERPLLRQRDNSHEEKVLASGDQKDRFRDIDNMTDSDEADMDDSDSDGQARAKRMKIESAATPMDDTPKWSNPDPYTSLPAPNESTGKKVDFVKMIRKARNEMGKQTADAGERAMDFISLGTNDGNAEPSSISKVPPMDGHASPHMQYQQSHMASQPTSSLPVEGFAKNMPLTDDTGQALGKRKRGDDKGTKATVRLVRVRGGDAYYSNAMILDQWRAADELNSAPWLQKSQETSSAIALHKEILDFYEWVRPQEYEFAVRAECIDRLTETLRRFHPGDLRAFGSYGARLFLPTGDMDLVFLDGPFLARLRKGERGINAPLTRNQFARWLDFIRRAQIALPGSIVPIAHAKVPIIKFQDKISRLKIDLSFNNDTGLVANDTFQKWRMSYPAMPIIVSLIKQFLMIRGLNDVSTGGLGGFSTICLVTSLIQHLPTNGGPQNLGELLLLFFDLYGNLLNRDKVAIRMEPPGYIDKESHRLQMYINDKKGRLTIIDPHRPDNNISGGTSQIALISRSFSDAHEVLQNRLASHSSGHPVSSFLTELIGGNFNAYKVQRDMLYSLHIGHPGSVAPAVGLPVISVADIPSSISRASAHSRQAVDASGDRAEVVNKDTSDSIPDSISISGSTNDCKPGPLSVRRAVRLKRLRPDISAKIGQRLSSKEAIKLGGYADAQQMVEDLDRRERGYSVRGLGSAEKRAMRLKTLRPDIASRVGAQVSVLEAMELGSYQNKEEMALDLNRREDTRKA